jgi:hypothetical protein
MNYKGDIIEESLENKEVLKKIKIISTRNEDVTDAHQTPWLTKWTIHAVDIPEGEVKEIAEELSKCLDHDNGGSWYIDFKNEDYHYVIFCDKVFCVDRKSREQYKEVRKYGIALGVPEYQMVNYQGVPLDVLANFLNDANKHTYANADAEKTVSSRLGSGDYHFEKDNLVYHDTYFGERSFIGEEIIYQDNKPMWGANYFGLMLDDDVDEKEVWIFLRKALMREYNNIIPLRGPKEFSENNWEYKFSAIGDLARFSGKEEIFYEGRLVYQLVIHGGFIE